MRGGVRLAYGPIGAHLTHSKQLGGASVHLEEGGARGLGPGHVALAYDWLSDLNTGL